MEESREFEIRDELRAKRANIHTFEELVEFLKGIDTDEKYDGYGETPRAMAQASVAVSNYFASKFGITGFQAGFVMWDFITDWQFRNNKCGLKIVDFDNMLYPQYDDKFDKTISSSVWNSLQEQAKKELDDHDHAHPNVKAHWQSIVDGIVPFGYRVKED